MDDEGQAQTPENASEFVANPEEKTSEEYKASINNKVQELLLQKSPEHPNGEYRPNGAFLVVNAKGEVLFTLSQRDREAREEFGWTEEHEMWALPQGGIKGDVEESLYRELGSELGIENNEISENLFYTDEPFKQDYEPGRQEKERKRNRADLGKKYFPSITTLNNDGAEIQSRVDALNTKKQQELTEQGKGESFKKEVEKVAWVPASEAKVKIEKLIEKLQEHPTVPELSTKVEKYQAYLAMIDKAAGMQATV